MRFHWDVLQTSSLVVFLLSITTLSGPTSAQVVTGELGAPGATTTIDGKQIPPPPAVFGGEIKEKASKSKTLVGSARGAPKGAPNVLLIMTDDVGFGAPGTFGGVIPDSRPRPHRRTGIALHQFPFHRALLADARGHHHGPQPSFGGDRRSRRNSDGLSGYDSIIPIDKGTVGTILKANGFATSWFGKNHNTPSYQSSQAGPFEQWPNGMGFEYFYGFVGGDASQWQPNLYRNTTAIYPFQGNPDWNLTTAMADEAIQHMKTLKEVAPEKPFFVYYVPGGTHAPHHPTPEWIKKIGDMHLFDQGWNRLRETIFANQKRLGIMPDYAKLTPWPKELPD